MRGEREGTAPGPRGCSQARGEPHARHRMARRSQQVRLLAVGVAGRAQCEGAGYQKRPVQGAQSKAHM